MISKKIMESVTKGYEDLDITNLLSDEFFDKFDYTRDTVLLIVSTLPLRDKVLLYKKYGKNYNGDFSTFENSFVMETIMPKIKRNLDKLGISRELVYLKDIFKEELDVLIFVSKKCGVYNYLALRFGKNLDNPMLVTSRFKAQAISKECRDLLVRELNNYKALYKIKLIKPFHEKFIKYKRNDETYLDFINRINKIVYTSLNEELLNEVIITYNNDLLSIIDYGQYPKGREHTSNLLMAYNVIKYYLSKEFKKKNLKYYSPIDSILDDDITLEEILIELSIMNERYIDLLKLKYGNNYDTLTVSGTLSKEENKYLCRGISFARQKIREKK